MTGESFIGRWSRRAIEARRPAPAATPAKPAAPAQPEPPDETQPPLPDPATLDAASDYTAFMRRDVPATLRKAALRQAWVTDEAISGFRGMAEYDWDFNAPGYLDPIGPEEAGRLLASILPPLPQEPEETTREAQEKSAPAQAALVLGQREDKTPAEATVSPPAPVEPASPGAPDQG